MSHELLEIPIFPINVVLFPGMALPLHIFEPRYREMTKDCLDSNMPIGIALAQPEGTTGTEVPSQMGTLARILDYHRLPDGRYNLLTAGGTRFEIVELRAGKPYMRALVRMIDDEPDDPEVADLAHDAHDALEAYLRVVLELVGSDDCEIAIPSDPRELSYLIAMCLAAEDSDKQHLLEMRSLAERLALGVQLLREEMEGMREHTGTGDTTTVESDRSRLN